MEQVIAPREIIEAIARDDLEAIKAWLAAGGDPNAKNDCSQELYGVWYPRLYPPGSRYETLLHRAAYFKWPDICEFLLSRGARVNATDDTEGCPIYATPLWQAVSSCEDVSSLATYGWEDATVEVLLSYGADPNLHVSPSFYCGNTTPLCQLLYLGNVAFNPITATFSIVRLLLRAGADPEDDPPCRWQGRNLTAEEHARISRDFFLRRLDDGDWDDDVDVLEVKAAQCAKVVDLLAGVRIAGSWPRYFLRPHMRCVVFRALCQRGRATYDHTTPTVLVRLFGAPPVRPDAPGILELDPNMPDLPDVVFWRVLTFMFGTAYDYPWVRPRLRARAAAATAAARS